MITAYISLGSNLGNKQLNLQNAIEQLCQNAGVVKQKSTIYDTAPWGFSSFNNFLNQAVELETTLSAKDLLGVLLKIERDMGRLRTSEGYQDRIIDLDIMFYGNEIISTKILEVPHPRLHQRIFMLGPMAELSPNYVHPILKKSIATLLDELGKSK